MPVNVAALYVVAAAAASVSAAADDDDDDDNDVYDDAVSSTVVIVSTLRHYGVDCLLTKRSTSPSTNRSTDRSTSRGQPSYGSLAASCCYRRSTRASSPCYYACWPPARHA